MSIEIEIRSSGVPDHQEHIHFSALCDSCPSVSEENGDYGPPPANLFWINEQGPLEEVVAECQRHEHEGGKEHRVRIVGVVHSPHTDKSLE